MPIFSVLASIIPLILRNGGAFETVCPLVCKWGEQLPPPPGSAAYVTSACDEMRCDVWGRAIMSVWQDIIGPPLLRRSRATNIGSILISFRNRPFAKTALRRAPVPVRKWVHCWKEMTSIVAVGVFFLYRASACANTKRASGYGVSVRPPIRPCSARILSPWILRAYSFARMR